MERTALPVRRNPVRQVIKAVLHVIVKVIVLTRRAIKRFPLPSLILLMALVGTYIAIDSGTLALPWGRTAAASSNEPLAIQTFLRGQQEFNAALMWESISDELRTTLERNGTTAQVMQQRMDTARKNGQQYTAHQYVAQHPLGNGNIVHFYMVTRAQGDQIRQIPLAFTINPAGKIVGID
jgi:hypothetical protein